MSKTIAVMAVGAVALAMTAGALASQSGSPFAGATYHHIIVGTAGTAGTYDHIIASTRHVPVDPRFLGPPIHAPGFGGHGASGFHLTPNAHNMPGSAGFEPKFTPHSGGNWNHIVVGHGGLPGSAGQEPLYKMNGGNGHVPGNHGGNAPPATHAGLINLPHIVPHN